MATETNRYSAVKYFFFITARSTNTLKKNAVTS